MKHKVYRFYVDFEKEEKWLNEMAAKGFNFIDYSFPGRYLFEKGTPGEYVYRLELLDSLPSEAKSKTYLDFMEDMGAELVATYLRWAWFRKKAKDGPFELYTDNSSKISHYQRISLFIGIVTILNIFAGLLNIGVGALWMEPRYEIHFNQYIGMFNFIVVLFCTRATVAYLSKIEKLKKENLVHE